MRWLAMCAVVLSVVVPGVIAAAQDADSQTQTVSCNLDDGSQVSVQYNPVAKNKEEPRNGKVWEPGGAPLTLYTQVPVVVNNVTIPVGAFSIYFIPDKKNWTMIVNKNVTAGSKYDEAQDLVRAPMELGNLGQPVKPVQVVMAHMGPKLCTIRLYYGTAGVLADFTEK